MNSCYFTFLSSKYLFSFFIGNQSYVNISTFIFFVYIVFCRSKYRGPHGRLAVAKCVTFLK